MAMEGTLGVINRMETDGIIGRYAIGGAVAAFNYIEVSTTDDLDILVSFDDAPGTVASGLITLGPLTAYLADRGYSEWRKEGVVIDGWPVQFLPVANDLDAEALAEAQDIILDVNPDVRVPTRVLSAEHLMANAIRVGRPKDFIRVSQFIEEKAFDPNRLKEILARFALVDAWTAFCARAGIQDPLDV